MDEVVSSFGQVANLVTEIAAASREQSAGIEQVTRAVSQMDEATQQNAALAEQAAAAESLEEQARTLVQAVGMFKLEGGKRPGEAGFVERRGPNRTVNVARLPARASEQPAAKRAAPLPPMRKSANANPSPVEDEWEEF